jgi:Tfp pilus assembly protein PilO
MNLTPKIKLLIIAVLGVSVIAVIIFVVILPQQAKLISLGKDMYDQRVNYEFITQQRQDLVYLERQIKEIAENHDNVSSTLFSQQDTLELITVLENIARTNDISDQNLSLSNPIALESGLFMSTINVTFNSTYTEIVNWALTIEQQPFYLIIDTMTLAKSKSSREGSDGKISVQMSAKVYWQ